MKERITILTGAGLTASPDFFGITTQGLTEQFISYNHPNLSDDKDFIMFIYNEFCRYNKLDPNDIRGNLNQINFETILQLIEELFAYIEDVDRTNHNNKNQNSVKYSLYILRKDIVDRINKARIQKWKDGTYFFIEKVFNHLIDVIIKELRELNNDKENLGMNLFNEFINKYYPSHMFTRRIYTLNYDNWLNEFAKYFDGFIKNEFNSRRVIIDKDTDCHYNLHGCILWDNFGVCKKLKVPEIRKHHQSFNGHTIAREALLPSPIISGYNKLTRINSSPYLELFHSFTNDCLTANKLLVIGYSFSDPHVNNNLEIIDKNVKIIIVVYYDQNSLKNNKSDFHRLIWKLNEVFKVSFSKLEIREGLKYTVDSDDQRVSIFINGVGDTFYEEFEKI